VRDVSKRKPTFNHGDKETRYRKACERLGSEAPHCILGDETNPHALQVHHVAGRESGGQTVLLDHNHHARVTDGQKDHPPKIDGCTNPLEHLGHFLLGLSELVAVATEDIGAHPLNEFLTYLRWELQEMGTFLIEMARSNPSADFRSVP
jgi:hypothetical protein